MDPFLKYAARTDFQDMSHYISFSATSKERLFRPQGSPEVLEQALRGEIHLYEPLPPAERARDQLIGRSVQRDSSVNTLKGEVAGVLKLTPGSFPPGDSSRAEKLYVVAWGNGEVTHHPREQMAAVVGQKEDAQGLIANAQQDLEIRRLAKEQAVRKKLDGKRGISFSRLLASD